MKTNVGGVTETRNREHHPERRRTVVAEVAAEVQGKLFLNVFCCRINLNSNVIGSLSMENPPPQQQQKACSSVLFHVPSESFIIESVLVGFYF